MVECSENLVTGIGNTVCKAVLTSFRCDGDLFSFQLLKHSLLLCLGNCSKYMFIPLININGKINKTQFWTLYKHPVFTPLSKGLEEYIGLKWRDAFCPSSTLSLHPEKSKLKIQ